MRLTLKEYRRYTRHLLRDFDIKITDEIKTSLRECKNRIEIEKIRDKLIDERLKRRYEMANFFKDYTKKSVEKLALTEADKNLLKVKNEGSTHDPKTLPKPEKDEE